MRLDLINKILNENPGLKAIYLDGWGEPLTHPQLEDILKTINNLIPSCKIYITTVADMLDQKIIDLLLKYNIYEIQFSLDPPSIYKSNRGVSYADIKKNIQAFMDANDKKGKKIRTCIKSIVSEQSKPLTDGLVDEWKSLDRAELIPAIKYDIVSARSTKCKELDSKRVVVLSDGRVTCCRADFRGGLLIGFATKDKLEDIYDDKNPDMKKRRDSHNAGTYPVFCRKCTEYSTAKAGKRF
jgi:MoaA/NifB/PqqE/SkfB family radical SAM enzyme